MKFDKWNLINEIWKAKFEKQNLKNKIWKTKFENKIWKMKFEWWTCNMKSKFEKLIYVFERINWCLILNEWNESLKWNKFGRNASKCARGHINLKSLKLVLLHFCETWFFNLLRPPSLPFCKIEANHSDSMFYYLKSYLFLMGDFEFAIPWITLTYILLQFPFILW